MDKWTKGEHYDRLLKEFLDKGGDLSLCPFDTADYKWEEPPYREIGSDYYIEFPITKGLHVYFPG